MFAIVLVAVMGASMVSADPIKETCTETIDNLGQTVRTCRRVGDIVKYGGLYKKHVDSTHTTITGPSQGISIHIPGNAQHTQNQQGSSNSNDRNGYHNNPQQNPNPDSYYNPPSNNYYNQGQGYYQPDGNRAVHLAGPDRNSGKTVRYHSNSPGTNDSPTVDGGLTLNNSGLYFHPTNDRSSVPDVDVDRF